MTAISGEGLCKDVVLPSGERLELLRGASLVVEEGEAVAIAGRSGSGKTTLLAVLGLLTSLDGGRLCVRDGDVAGLNDRQRSHLRNAQIGFVFQAYSLVSHLTAAENVALPLLQGKPVGRAEARRRVGRAMELVGIAHRADSRPRQLSGGEQQRTAIARALVRSPVAILADEPTGALDTATAEHVLDALTQAAQQDGTALVLVTHDPLVAARADRTLLLEDGRLHQGGSVASV
jgi:ABC-type lipoprotein export system ATPase subunit